MGPKAPFKKCARCGTKLPSSDGHNFCVICLGETHKVDICPHCQAFSKLTRQHRADKLWAELWEKALAAVDKPAMASQNEPFVPPAPVKPTTIRADRPRQDTPATPGRSLTASVAKKLSKKARTPKSSEKTKHKKKDKSAKRHDAHKNKTSTALLMPDRASLSTVQPTSITTAPPVSMVDPITTASLSEGEIRDTASTRHNYRQGQIESRLRETYLLNSSIHNGIDNRDPLTEHRTIVVVPWTPCTPSILYIESLTCTIIEDATALDLL